jgi:nitrous oxidase accessory protein
MLAAGSSEGGQRRASRGCPTAAAAAIPCWLALAAACGDGSAPTTLAPAQGPMVTGGGATDDGHHGGTAWSGALPTEHRPPPIPSPPPPEHGVDVAAGSDLHAAIAAAAPGAVLRLAAGRYPGPVTISKPLTLWGPLDAIVQSRGEGSTVKVAGDDVVLQGFTVDGSGGRFDTLDAALRVRGRRARIEGLTVRAALFGILVEQSEEVALVRNRVIGTGQAALGLRGDAIRLWETRNSLIEGNVVTDSRDVVVWYSSGNALIDNWVAGGRYGTHFMYSHDSTVIGNTYVANVVGVFVMYSRDVKLQRNLLAGSSGAGGMGLGVKESGNLTVTNNWFVQDEIGVYLDTSPLDLNHHNRFAENLLWLCGTAITFHSSPKRNVFERNALRDNDRQVAVEGRGDATAVEWRGNEFDDYRGYDLDGDGVGDVPYELRSLSTELTGRFPNLAFFRGTPALQVVDVTGHVLPTFAPKLLLVDPHPAMQLALEVPRAR